MWSSKKGAHFNFLRIIARKKWTLNRRFSTKLLVSGIRVVESRNFLTLRKMTTRTRRTQVLLFITEFERRDLIFGLFALTTFYSKIN